MVNGIRVINNKVLTNQSYSDHAPIVLTIGIDGENTIKCQKFRDTSFLKSPKTVTGFLEMLENSLNAITYNGQNRSENFEKFQSTFNAVFQCFAPMRENKQNKKVVPMWFDKSLRNQITKQNLHRKWKKNKSDCRQLSKFKAARAEVEQLIKKQKKEFYLEKFNKCIGDSRQIYRFLNELKGIKGKKCSVPVLVENGQRFDEPKEIAMKFNKIFAEVGPKLRSALKNTSNYELNFESPLSMYPYPTDTIEIHQIIENLECKSSSGIDEISKITVKAAGPVICEHLVFLIKSLSEGIFPSSLKLAKVLPLQKNGSKDDVNNYRPISLLVVWSKIFQRVVFNRIFNYLEEHSYINENQFAFRKKHSTIDAVAKLVEVVRDSKLKMELIAFLLDIKKAFDTIDHEILLHKLDRYDKRGKSLKWTESFLTDQKQ